MGEEVAKVLREEFLGGNVKEVDLALEGEGLDLLIFDAAAAAVDVLGFDAHALEPFDLVFHEGNEGGDDDGDAVQDKGWDLETDGFASACGHEDHAVLA